jgi:hypothetical protein
VSTPFFVFHRIFLLMSHPPARNVFVPFNETDGNIIPVRAKRHRRRQKRRLSLEPFARTFDFRRVFQTASRCHRWLDFWPAPVNIERVSAAGPLWSAAARATKAATQGGVYAMMRDHGYWEAVVGRVIDGKTKRPVVDAQVRAFDKDVLKDDALGEAFTDRKGKFRIDFAQRDYQGAMALAEGRPDIYLKIDGPKGRSMDTPVHYEMEGKMEPSNDPEKKGPDGEIEVLDMGDIVLE